MPLMIPRAKKKTMIITTMMMTIILRISAVFVSSQKFCATEELQLPKLAYEGQHLRTFDCTPGVVQDLSF